MVMMDRRALIKYTTSAASAACLLPGVSSGSSKHWPYFDRSIVINNLGSVDNPNRYWDDDGAASIQGPGQERRYNLDARVLRDLHASGTTALNLTIGYVAGPMEPFEHSVREVAHWNQLIKHNSNDLLKIESTADILQAKRDRKIGIILGFQNAAMIGDHVDRVDIFADLGVKTIQLTYNIANQIGSGSMASGDRGLTEFGFGVVERLNQNRTLIDLSNSGERTCVDAINASQGPVCISHSGCSALANLPRNKTDYELRFLAEKGGCVGIYFMPFLKEDNSPDADDVVRHIEHAVNVCGEDHVGIGTDGGTTAVDNFAAYQRLIDKEIERRQQAGISATGEKPGVVPLIPDLQGPGQFQQLADMLYSRGHSSRRIEKILGGNFLRLQKQVWGA
jgi:membrane dipeptidase